MGRLTVGVLLASYEAALLHDHHDRESDHVCDGDGGDVRPRYLILSTLLLKYLVMRECCHTCCSSVL
jgi:hypothetical protein